MRVLCARGSALIPLLAVAALACGGEGSEMAADATPSMSEVGDSTAAPTGPLDVCDLIERDAIESALGTAVADPTHTVLSEANDTSAAVAQCTYDAAGSGARVTIYARRSAVNENTAAAIEGVRSRLGGSGVQVVDVSGVGDEAFRAGDQLHVFVGGNRYLVITVAGTANDSAAARTIALRAVERI